MFGLSKGEKAAAAQTIHLATIAAKRETGVFPLWWTPAQLARS